MTLRDYRETAQLDDAALRALLAGDDPVARVWAVWALGLRNGAATALIDHLSDGRPLASVARWRWSWRRVGRRRRAARLAGRAPRRGVDRVAPAGGEPARDRALVRGGLARRDRARAGRGLRGAPRPLILLRPELVWTALAPLACDDDVFERLRHGVWASIPELPTVLVIELAIRYPSDDSLIAALDGRLATLDLSAPRMRAGLEAVRAALAGLLERLEAPVEWERDDHDEEWPDDEGDDGEEISAWRAELRERYRAAILAIDERLAASDAMLGR